MLNNGTKVRIKSLKEHPNARDWDPEYQDFCGLEGYINGFEALRGKVYYKIDFEGELECEGYVWKKNEFVILSKKLELE